MDPKTLASLDPKLRETYERVMGTSASTGAAPAPAQNVATAPAAPAAPPPSTAYPAAAAAVTQAVAHAPTAQLPSSTAPDAPPMPAPPPNYSPLSLEVGLPSPRLQYLAGSTCSSP